MESESSFGMKLNFAGLAIIAPVLMTRPPSSQR
jgi:hypothetical protein